MSNLGCRAKRTSTGSSATADVLFAAILPTRERRGRGSASVGCERGRRRGSMSRDREARRLNAVLGNQARGIEAIEAVPEHRREMAVVVMGEEKEASARGEGTRREKRKTESMDGGGSRDTGRGAARAGLRARYSVGVEGSGVCLDAGLAQPQNAGHGQAHAMTEVPLPAALQGGGLDE